MQSVRPVYLYALAVAIAIFVAGVSVALADLYVKVGAISHELMHVSGKCSNPAHYR